MPKVTRFRFADKKTMKLASDALGDSEKPLFAVIISADDTTVVVHAKDKDLAIELFEQAKLVPEDIHTRQAVGDEKAIMNWVADAPKLDEQGWPMREEEASFRM